MRRPRADRDPRRDATELALLAELAAIYGEVDALLSGWSCDASTECCRFGITGREPWVTSIERRAVERALAARGGQLSGAKRALPIANDERTCAMLDRDGRCAIYASRPLGCRTYFCERAAGPGRLPRDAIARLARRIRDLAARHVPAGDQTRPLGRIFER